MARLIRLTNDARQRLTVSLGGRLITLSVWWQPLSVAWYLSVAVANEPVVSGRQIAPAQPLIGNSDALEGELVAVTSDGAAPGNLGRDAWADEEFQLVWLTAAEVAGLRPQ